MYSKKNAVGVRNLNLIYWEVKYISCFTYAIFNA